MKYALLLLAIISCCLSMQLSAQSAGPYAGGNMNFVNDKSDYAIADDLFKALPSYSFGGFYKSNKNQKFGFLGILDYSRLRNGYNHFIFVGETGAPLFTSNNKLSNHTITANTMATIRFNKLYTGAGLAAGYVISSKTKIEDASKYFNRAPSKGNFNNSYYNTLSLSLPFVFGIEINRFDIMARFNLGISNRIDDDSYVKEYNNTLHLGIAYSLWRRE